VDGVHGIAVYNGIAKIVLVRLDTNGTNHPVVELSIPVGQISTIVRALSTIRG
jgi:hypothetical protein